MKIKNDITIEALKELGFKSKYDHDIGIVWYYPGLHLRYYFKKLHYSPLDIPTHIETLKDVKLTIKCFKKIEGI